MLLTFFEGLNFLSLFCQPSYGSVRIYNNPGIDTNNKRGKRSVYSNVPHVCFWKRKALFQIQEDRGLRLSNGAGRVVISCGVPQNCAAQNQVMKVSRMDKLKSKETQETGLPKKRKSSRRLPTHLGRREITKSFRASQGETLTQIGETLRWREGRGWRRRARGQVPRNRPLPRF